MKSNYNQLGQYIEMVSRTNSDLKYGIEDVRGCSNTKQMMQTRANLIGRTYEKFIVLRPQEFVFNRRTTRNGEKIGMAYNNTDREYIFTNDYVSFYVKPEVKNRILLPDYLYMWYLRPEFDRYMLFKTYGSATLFFSWDNMCELEIELPDLPTQQKYVDVYNAMVANQQAYERGLEDLKLTCDALIDKVKHTAIKKAIRELLAEVDNRNDNGTATNVQGINIEKQFMPSVADITGVDLKKYKLVQNGQFAFSGMQTGRDKCIRIALYREDKPIIISPAYTVFETKDTTVSPEYIMIWFSRMETDRRGWFMSDSSIRTNLDLDRFYGRQHLGVYYRHDH